jgi:hypothetical protein
MWRCIVYNVVARTSPERAFVVASAGERRTAERWQARIRECGVLVQIWDTETAEWLEPSREKRED